MRYEIRPLGHWTDPVTDPRRTSNVFKASWRDTLDLLGDEITKLEGVEPVVFQIDVTEGDIRLDGMLRANAKVGHPGVVISFQSKYGPLRYATDAHERVWSGAMPGWQANIRAIALALQALRAVDRYGVTKRGEQYTGWKALPSGSGSGFGTADDALRWMREMFAGQVNVRADDLTDAPAAQLYRRLARTMHPDAGGTDADWERLDQARQLLVAGGVL